MPGPNSKMYSMTLGGAFVKGKTDIDRKKGKINQHDKNIETRRGYNQTLSSKHKGANQHQISFPVDQAPTPGLHFIFSNWAKSSRRQSKRHR